mmetsp:Transcript_24396/g.49774  ORF Transcript_24396/g.49774 Transcript_24396/m.49774 type:complete len:804 (+) Transcript_24396:1319-3730(+)
MSRWKRTTAPGTATTTTTTTAAASDNGASSSGGASTTASSGSSSSSESTGTIVVGEATFRSPYLQYGEAVGMVLLDFHQSGFEGGVGTDQEKRNPATLDLVDWCLELGHAHLDDAEHGVSYEENGGNDYYDRGYHHHPKTYHIQLALQAYDWAQRTLNRLASESEGDGRHNEKGGFDEKGKMIELQYQAFVQLATAEAYSLLGGGSGSSSSSSSTVGSTRLSDEKTHADQALSFYRKAQDSFEKLRYSYARLNDQRDDYYFNEDRYYSIESGYAKSCLHLGMSLYSKVILTQNEKIFEANEKTMEMLKQQFGWSADGTEDGIMDELMRQVNGGMGGGFGGGGFGATSSFSFSDDDGSDDWGDLLGMNDLAEEMNGELLEVATYLDTAILAYQQHAFPNQPSPGSISHASSPSQHRSRSFTLIVNGVRQKSETEIKEVERLFDWKSSLAMAYQDAAIVATARNQHIRSRELTNLSLRLYVDSILPYYEEYEEHASAESGRKDTRYRSRTMAGNGHSVSPMSFMTVDYAKASVGSLYLSLADTDFKLGSYVDCKDWYDKAMDWHTDHALEPALSGSFYTLMGDELGMRQYQELINTYVQQLDQYKQDLKLGGGASFFFRDDYYEAEMHSAIAPMYMAIGKADLAIGSYRGAIEAYERITTDDLTDVSNKSSLLYLAEARFGLATALFHGRRYTESKARYAESTSLYQKLYGEGTPPAADGFMGGSIEEMKDLIVDNYGQDYYDKLKAQYDKLGGTGSGESATGNGVGVDAKLATNFNVVGYHNETWNDDNDDDDDYSNEDDHHEL